MEAPLPALEGGMVGTDGDERAAACGGDDAIRRQFGVDDDAIAGRPRSARRAARPAGRPASGGAGGSRSRRSRSPAGRSRPRSRIDAHRRGPVGVAVEQRPDDPAVEHVLERGVVGERLPARARARQSRPSRRELALDPEAVLVRRAAAEAARCRRVQLLEAGLGSVTSSAPEVAGDVRLGAAPQVELLGREAPVVVDEVAAVPLQDVVRRLPSGASPWTWTMTTARPSRSARS